MTTYQANYTHTATVKILASKINKVTGQREYRYSLIDTTTNRVVLNSYDTIERCKIAHDGLYDLALRRGYTIA